MNTAGSVRETYHAAIQHDLVDLAGGEHLAGVVRRPTPWFYSGIDENYPDLGPPEALLDETKQRQEDFQMRGMCEEGALNAAWEEVDFADRYREYLAGSEDAQSALATLADRVREGEDVVLVCYEADNKRCHRHLLKDHVEDRL